MMEEGRNRRLVFVPWPAWQALWPARTSTRGQPPQPFLKQLSQAAPQSRHPGRLLKQPGAPTLNSGLNSGSLGAVQPLVMREGSALGVSICSQMGRDAGAACSSSVQLSGSSSSGVGWAGKHVPWNDSRDAALVPRPAAAHVAPGRPGDSRHDEAVPTCLELAQARHLEALRQCGDGGQGGRLRHESIRAGSAVELKLLPHSDAALQPTAPQTGRPQLDHVRTLPPTAAGFCYAASGTWRPMSSTHLDGRQLRRLERRRLLGHLRHLAGRRRYQQPQVSRLHTWDHSSWKWAWPARRAFQRRAPRCTTLPCHPLG